jgi:chemosensory pili system protein ChpC
MSAPDTEVYSLLVPLAGSRLIVPRTCVADLMAYKLPAQVPGAPPWYLGTTGWNGREIPLVSFESMCGEELPPASSRARVVVFHALLGRLDCEAFGLLVQGFPQLVRMRAEMLQPDSLYDRPVRAPVLSRVRLLRDGALIPDLEQMEAVIADETSVATR